MKKIRLDLGERSYNIVIGQGVSRNIKQHIESSRFSGPIVAIADKTVLLRSKKILKHAFGGIRSEVHWIEVPEGERSKSLMVYEKIVLAISKKTQMHRPRVVAVGGGVVGDLAGFVAATYRRGVPLIQVPTTLLAQVDSSIGGKAGIDIPEAKNLIGAFKQPEIVLIDTDFLSTLPPRQLCNGLAEVIKYGVIRDRDLFEYLEKNREKILSMRKEALEHIIFRCASIKARVVERDEYDNKDHRIILNFGHTIGHAIEAASGYTKAYNHGESVAIGMLAASEIALNLEMIAEKEYNRIKKLVASYGLPVRAKGVSHGKIINSYLHDKKFTSGSNRFVLPRRIGSVEVVEDIPDILVRNVIRKYAE